LYSDHHARDHIYTTSGRFAAGELARPLTHISRHDTNKTSTPCGPHVKRPSPVTHTKGDTARAPPRTLSSRNARRLHAPRASAPMRVCAVLYAGIITPGALSPLVLSPPPSSCSCPLSPRRETSQVGTLDCRPGWGRSRCRPGWGRSRGLGRDHRLALESVRGGGFRGRGEVGDVRVFHPLEVRAVEEVGAAVNVRFPHRIR